MGHGDRPVQRGWAGLLCRGAGTQDAETDRDGRTGLDCLREDQLLPQSEVVRHHGVSRDAAVGLTGCSSMKCLYGCVWNTEVTAVRSLLCGVCTYHWTPCPDTSFI